MARTPSPREHRLVHLGQRTARCACGAWSANADPDPSQRRRHDQLLDSYLAHLSDYGARPEA